MDYSHRDILLKHLRPFPSVAANARYKDGGDTIKRIAASHQSVRRPNEKREATQVRRRVGLFPLTSSLPLLSPTRIPQVNLEPAVPEEAGERNVCYVHKVVGGMVIKEPVG